MLQYLATQEQSRRSKNKKKRERERKKKRDKYQDLRVELRRLWDKPEEIFPLIIGPLGTIPKSVKRNLEGLGADVAPGLLQKRVVLETAHIIRRVMDS